MPARRPTSARRTTRRAARPSLARRLGTFGLHAVRSIGAPAAARPGLCAGLAAGGLLFAFIAANALHGQPGRHPRPLLATRGAAATTAETSVATTNDTGLMPVPLVLEVQTALHETGHYSAALDGKPGAATTAAIRAFQSERGLSVDGQPSPRLLSAIRRIPGAAPERHAGVEAGSEPAASPGRSDSAEALTRSELVRRIQSGLAAAEVASLDADGVLGERTRAAIRAFEALEGLDVTGEPDERILKRLIEIGAVR